MGALRLYDHDMAENVWLPASGVPWFMTIFGRDSQPIKTIASNQGHLLWSGIVPPARAEDVARRFFEEHLWSGWGIRTLSAASPAY
jgi:glycogen debranching enzyme